MAIGVGQKVTAHGSGVTTLTSSSITTSASGSKIVVGAVHGSGSGALGTLSDNKGNTYSLLDAVDTGTSAFCYLFYCETVTGGSGHTFTFDCVNSHDPSFTAVEITGAASTALDIHDNGVDYSPPFTITTGTMTQANNIVVAFCATDTGTNPSTYTESTGFTTQGTEQDGTLYWTHYLGTKIVSATTALTPSITCTDASQAGIAYVVIKEGAGDVTAPSLTLGPTASSITSSGFDIKGTPDEAGTAYLIVTAVGASQPSDGTFDASTETASMTASAEFTIHHTGQ